MIPDDLMRVYPTMVYLMAVCLDQNDAPMARQMIHLQMIDAQMILQKDLYRTMSDGLSRRLQVCLM
jgi:hypothetical protein